jgi:hypothetical protein
LAHGWDPNGGPQIIDGCAVFNASILGRAPDDAPTASPAPTDGDDDAL